MGFELVLTKKARQDLEALDPSVSKRIVQKLLWWQRQADPLAHARQLKESAAGDVRFRVGDYRLIAVIKKAKRQVVIVKIGHRREIYL